MAGGQSGGIVSVLGVFECTVRRVWGKAGLLLAKWTANVFMVGVIEVFRTWHPVAKSHASCQTTPKSILDYTSDDKAIVDCPLSSQTSPGLAGIAIAAAMVGSTSRVRTIRWCILFAMPEPTLFNLNQT